MLTLHRLSLGYRILYTGVLVFMTAGTVVHGVRQHVRSGVGPALVAAWYRGNEADPAATVLLFPRSFEETLGDAWLSITSYTIAYLVLGSILVRSEASRRTKEVLLLGYGLAALMASAAPLLVRYAAAGFAVLDSAALVALPLLSLAIMAVAVRDMWSEPEAPVRFRPAGPPEESIR